MYCQIIAGESCVENLGLHKAVKSAVKKSSHQLLMDGSVIGL